MPEPMHLTKLDYAEAVLRAAILSGEIQPGERLRLEHLAKKFGISATPLREAVNRLQAEGLVRATPHRGVHVVRLSPDEAHELYLMLGALEGLAARLGAASANSGTVAEVERIHDQARLLLKREPMPDELTLLNRSFHVTLYQDSGMNMLLESIDKLYDKVHWDTLRILPGRPQRTFHEHSAILDALRRGDARKVGELTTNHVESLAESVASYIREQQGSDFPRLARASIC